MAAITRGPCVHRVGTHRLRFAASGVVFLTVLFLASVALAPSVTANAASSVSTPSVTVTTSAAVGATAGYTVKFTTSSTGGLSGTAGSTVKTVFPSGTNLNSLSSATLTDTTTAKVVGFANSSTTTTLTFLVYSGSVVNAGDQLSADVERAINPSTAATTYTVTVSTSSDTSPVVSSTYAIVAGHPVSTPMVTPSNNAAGATGVAYTVQFTTSVTGGLSGTAGSTVKTVFPSGTNLNSLSSATLTDTTTAKVVGFANSSATTTLTFLVYSGSVVNAGDKLSAAVAGAINPSTPSQSDTAQVWTSSDLTQVTSCPYFIGTGPAAPCVTALSPATGPAAGGTRVKIKGINFTGATSVLFGTVPATGVVVNSSILVTATAPAGSGNVNVTVTTPAGTSPTGPANVYKYIPPPKVTTTSLPAGTVNVSYSATLTAKGGKTPYTWSISVGSLPPNLSLDPATGVISGTPTTSGTYGFTVKVTDSENPPQSATKPLSITIA